MTGGAGSALEVGAASLEVVASVLVLHENRVLVLVPVSDTVMTVYTYAV